MVEDANNAPKSCDPFRAQLILPEQRQLYDYWSGLAAAGGQVMRSSVKPRAIPLLLPNISLVQANSDSTQFRYRLAGTKLRDIFYRDVTGLELAEAFSGSAERYWRRTFTRAIETAAPCQGVLRGPQRDKENLVQFWLRLPLYLDSDIPEMILGLDMCFLASDNPDADELKAVIESLDNAETE